MLSLIRQPPCVRRRQPPSPTGGRTKAGNRMGEAKRRAPLRRERRFVLVGAVHERPAVLFCRFRAKKESPPDGSRHIRYADDPGDAEGDGIGVVYRQKKKQPLTVTRPIFHTVRGYFSVFLVSNILATSLSADFLPLCRTRDSLSAFHWALGPVLISEVCSLPSFPLAHPQQLHQVPVPRIFPIS